MADINDLLFRQTSLTADLSLLGTQFMINALIAGTLIAIAAGTIGYFVLLRDQAFATHAIAHIGFPGATLAALLFINPVWGLLVACVGGGLAIGAFGHRKGDREVVTGTILAFASGLGILFASIGSRQSGMVTNILFGNILAVSQEQLVVFAVITVVVLIAMVATGRQLMFCSIDPEVAAAKGIPVRALSTVFLICMSLVIAISVTVVGVLLIFALLVTPAATAIRITARPAAVVIIATSISVVSVWAGLVVSTYQPWPPSFIIVTIACAIWVVTMITSARRRNPNTRVAS